MRGNNGVKVTVFQTGRIDAQTHGVPVEGVHRTGGVGLLPGIGKHVPKGGRGVDHAQALGRQGA